LRAAFHVAGQVIAAAPLGSLRILTIFESRFDDTAPEALKRYGAANRPFVHASAVVATGFWKVLLASQTLRGRRDLVVFDREATALDWLAAT
jgi:hypothetical protein